MSASASGRHRVEISATVDPWLIEAVDAFVREHPDFDRSKVIDEALRLWYAREKDRAMEAQFAEPDSPEEDEERAAWRQIQAAAAERLFRSR